MMGAGIPRKRLVIGMALIAMVVIGLVWVSMRDAMVYYVTVAEALAQPHAAGGQVRVSGVVDGDSIQYDAQGPVLRFTLVEGEDRLPVTYRGSQPDMLRDGATAIVEGTLDAQGILAAHELMLQCPSKYVSTESAGS